jgi:hypothetical protein
MNARWQLCNRSLSRSQGGRAVVRVLLIVAAVLVLWFAIRHFFPSREERLWRFVDETRDAFMEKDEPAFLAAFDPAVSYQGKGGIAEIKRDWKTYQSMGLGRPNVTKSEATLDDDGADVRLEVVLLAGLRPVAQPHVKMRLVEEGKKWRIKSVSWTP